MTNLSENRARPGRRRTVGLLLDNIYESYGIKLWSGVVAAVQAEDLNLVCFVGGALDNPNNFLSQKNAVFDLVSPKNIDGIVSVSGSLGTLAGTERLSAFYARYSPIPLVSIGIPMYGIPSILADNRTGVRELFSHFITVHGCKRIAFIRGPSQNEEADLRYRVYREELERNGMEYDPDLVVQGDFTRDAGIAAARTLVSERRVRFDALMGANDYMAIYAMKELVARGVRVPADVAVAGFDDIKESYGVIPSLTTVRQPLFELGKSAVRTLVAAMNGKEVRECAVLPTRLVVRRSCGCFPHSGQDAAAPFPRGRERADREETAIRDELERSIASAMEEAFTGSKERIDPSLWAMRLTEAFLIARKSDSGTRFFYALEDLLMKSASCGIDVLAWYSIVSTLFDYGAEVCGDGSAERYRHEALVLIGETADRIQAYFRANAEEQAVVLFKISQSLIANFDGKKLKRVLAKELPGLGIGSCYVSLYGKGASPRSRARQLLAFAPGQERGNTARLRRYFPSSSLVPGTLRRIGRRFTFLVMPLYFKTEQLGFVLFEMGPVSGTIYETLASQLSSALKGVKLVRKRKHLEKEITEISRKEQMRIGQDLHDGLCQHLTGISFMCKVLRDQLKQKALPEAESADEICALINESIATTRNLAKGLFPVELEENGFVVALQELISTLEHQSRIPCSFAYPSSVLISDNSLASNLFRIAQEAVTNAIKHAHPGRVCIELREENGTVFLAVRDDGIGLPDNIRGKGIGLMTMKYRANIMGAKLSIKRGRDGGTVVSCSFRNRPPKHGREERTE